MNTPLFVVNEEKLLENLEVLASVKERTGCKILLALKGFALLPLILWSWRRSKGCMRQTILLFDGSIISWV